MKWRKLGLTYTPSGNLWWAKSYAILPTAEITNEQVIRVYFASLDEYLFGRIGFVELDPNDPQRILYESKEPVLNIGEIGTFDDSGVNPSCVLNVNDRKYMYYIGWQRVERVPHMLFSGLAIANQDGDKFTRYSRVPILDRTTEEPFSRSAPFVVIENGIFRMWYWSCEHWSDDKGWTRYNTVIKYAESGDGINWSSRNIVCIAPEGQSDYAVGRPWVIKEGNLYKMWYSIRSSSSISYRLGYAESTDGLSWHKKDDEAGLNVSEVGWDSEMICFSSVVDIKDTRYIFYNGNGHGKTGFGCAVLESH
ncbi:MAG: hypothetical protein ACYSSN_07595 [Planctomycetota bacterium]|jgi:predicted GH43/DUF377 family glycosyl hydrolase